MSTAMEGYPTVSTQSPAQHATLAVDGTDYGRRLSNASSIDEHFSPQQRRQSEALSMISNVESLRAGKLPTNQQLSSTMNRLISSKVIERNRGNLSEDGQVLLRDFQELLLAFQRALQTKNRDELFQSFVYHVRRSEAAIKDSGVTEEVSAGLQQKAPRAKKEAKMTGKEILKVVKLFLFNSQFRALLGQMLSIAQQTMGDAVKLGGKKMQENADSLTQGKKGQVDGSRAKEAGKKLKNAAVNAVGSTQAGVVGMTQNRDTNNRSSSKTEQQTREFENSSTNAYGGKRQSLPLSNKEFPDTHHSFLNRRFENADLSAGRTDDAGHTLEDDKQHGAVLHTSGAASNRLDTQHQLSPQQYQRPASSTSSGAARETTLNGPSSGASRNIFLANPSSTQPTADPKNESRRSMEVTGNNNGEQKLYPDIPSFQTTAALEQETSGLPEYNMGENQLRSFMTDSTDIKPLECTYSGMHDQSLSTFSTGFLENTIRTAGDYRREEFYGRSATTSSNEQQKDASTASPQYEQSHQADHQQQSSDYRALMSNTAANSSVYMNSPSASYLHRSNESDQKRRGSIDAYYENYHTEESEHDKTSIKKPWLQTDENLKSTREICPGMTSFPAYAALTSQTTHNIENGEDNKSRRWSAPDQTDEDKGNYEFVATSPDRSEQLKVNNHANDHDDTKGEAGNSRAEQAGFIQQQAMNDLGAAYITSSDNGGTYDNATTTSVDEKAQLSSKTLLQGAGFDTGEIEDVAGNGDGKHDEDSVSTGEIISQLKEILTTIQKNSEYQQAINTLISLFETWSKHISSGKEQFERRRSSTVNKSEQADYYLNLATIEAKTIIEDWAKGASLDPLLQQTADAVASVRHDNSIKNLFDAATNYIKRLLKEPGYLASDDSTEDGNQILNGFRNSETRNKVMGKMDSLIEAYSSYIGRISDDANSKEISRKIKDIHDHLWYNRDGHATFKPQLLNDMRICLLPALIEQIKYVPLPNVLYSDKQYDIAIENMVLKGDTLMPNIIEVRADDYLRFSPNTKLSYTNSQSFTVHLSGVQAAMEEAVFYYKRKVGFPRVSDSGVVSLNTGGRGLNMSIRLVTSSVDQTHTFRVDQCHCQIDKLNINVKSCRHNVLYKVFNPMLTGIIKRQVCKAIERKVTEMVETGDVKVTRFLHRKQARGELSRRNSAGNRPGLFAHVSNIFNQKIASI